MPSMYVNIPKMEKETKEKLVKDLYEASATVLKVPAIYTFVNEYDTVFKNGEECEAPMMIINMEAGPMPADKIELMGEAMTNAIKNVMGEEQSNTMVYHANGLDHIAVNGKLIKK